MTMARGLTDRLHIDYLTLLVQDFEAEVNEWFKTRIYLTKNFFFLL